MKAAGGFFRVFRIWTAIVCLSMVSIFIANVPTYFKRLSAECITARCTAAPGPPPGLEALHRMGMNEQLYATFYTLLDCLFIIGFLAAAAIVFWKQGHELMGLLGTILLVSFGISFPSLMSVAAEHQPFLQTIIDSMSFIGWMSLTAFFLLFPSGRLVLRRSLWMLFVIGGLLSSGYLKGLPDWIMYVRILLIFGLLLFAQIYRYRHVSAQVERQQTKWVVYGLTVAIVGYLGVVFIPLLFNPRIFEEGSLAYFMVFNSLVYACLLLIPTTLVFALLRRRLWDIDPLLSRTLLYTIMMAFVIGVYAAVVWYLSYIFKTDDHIVVSIIAASIAAVTFSPIKERMQQLIIRKMYGEQGNPYVVLALLGQRIQDSKSPEQILEQVARTLKEILRLPYASIELVQDEEFVTLTHYGTQPEEVRSLPISYRGNQLGYLRVAPRSPGEAFTKSDHKLWEVLLHQLGPLLQDLKSTMDLKALNRDLQGYRERLVRAREEERHYLRRNLHDDLAPRLAALAYTAAAAEELIEKEPHTARLLLEEHQRMILGTVDDIRRLVYDLRPPALDELGLVEALRQRIHELASITSNPEPGVVFTFEAPPEANRIPAAVEVAVYRIVSESVTNVVRHARAKFGSVKIAVNSERLELEITDDGVGIGGPRTTYRMGGLGLPSMKERAAELGGELRTEAEKMGGTRVFAWIPLSKEDD